MRTDRDILSEKYEIRADLKSEQTLVALYRSVHPSSRLRSILRWNASRQLECAICGKTIVGPRSGTFATEHLSFHGLKNHLTAINGGGSFKPRRNIAAPTDEKGNVMNPQSRPRVAGKVSNPQIQTSPPVQKESNTMTETENTPETTDETNGTNVKESALKPIRDAWVAAGAKMPSADEGEKLKKAYRAAKSAVDAADKAAADARAKLSEVARVIMEKTGARTVTIDGVDHIPSVHGKSYFFRARGERTPAVSL